MSDKHGCYEGRKGTRHRPGAQHEGGVLQTVGGQVRLLDAGVIRVPRDDNDMASRLKELFDGVMEVLAEHKPDCFAMEQLYSHYETAANGHLDGHARGVICLAAP